MGPMTKLGTEMPTIATPMTLKSAAEFCLSPAKMPRAVPRIREMTMVRAPMVSETGRPSAIRSFTLLPSVL